MNSLNIVINNISLVIDYYDKIKIYRAASEEGVYSEITGVGTRIDIITEKTVYYYQNDHGLTSSWYKNR